ncbi:uncharacterized protein LOC131221624 isoform X2 [Magnolia sinica]|uniref:uncharacterized protein LOC131221624 isoform X2 n=1 Tax=Magnolia sinica TaxID=86752 RepID=UPI00265849F4|nr:uncharacterized protein LOC131221624 isoform X2 [Magnolia sinica]
MQERCGWQVCIFAYGQVGFGKTYHNGYTVRSQTERATRAWEQIFQISPSLSSLGWTFTMQFQGGFLSSTPSCTKQVLSPRVLSVFSHSALLYLPRFPSDNHHTLCRHPRQVSVDLSGLRIRPFHRTVPQLPFL